MDAGKPPSPCEGGGRQPEGRVGPLPGGILSGSALAAEMRSAPCWTGDGASISRTVALPSFRLALEAVLAVGEVAERENHHPDIDIRYRTLTFVLTTHDQGGLTASDFSVARQIDGIIEGMAAL